MPRSPKVPPPAELVRAAQLGQLEALRVGKHLPTAEQHRQLERAIAPAKIAAATRGAKTFVARMACARELGMAAVVALLGPSP